MRLISAGIFFFSWWLTFSDSFSPSFPLEEDTEEGKSWEREIRDVVESRKEWEKHCLSPSKSNIPRHELVKGCTLYFLHVHKTGGTTMCYTARKNGFVANQRNNCNAPVEISNVERKTHSGVVQEFVARNNISFIGQEFAGFHPNISENNKFLYITTVRHPVDRLISHLHHTLCQSTPDRGNFLLARANCTTIKDIRKMKLSELILDPCFQKLPGFYRVTTDFYINMFMKCELSCTMLDLKNAMKMLHYFSAIVVSDSTEEFDRYASLLDLKFSMKFDKSFRKGTQHHSHRDLFFQSVKHNLPEIKEILANATELDMRFYSYAKKLASIQLKEEQAAISRMEQYYDEEIEEENSEVTIEDNKSSSAEQEGPFCAL